ncbi:MAG: hypothetical protein H0X27_08395 [Caulobacteraceae bacterium]|nr:hypothetical protein [Caulobacteraceae bacterium]
MPEPVIAWVKSRWPLAASMTPVSSGMTPITLVPAPPDLNSRPLFWMMDELASPRAMPVSLVIR